MNCKVCKQEIPGANPEGLCVGCLAELDDLSTWDMRRALLWTTGRLGVLQEMGYLTGQNRLSEKGQAAYEALVDSGWRPSQAALWAALRGVVGKTDLEQIREIIEVTIKAEEE